MYAANLCFDNTHLGCLCYILLQFETKKDLMSVGLLNKHKVFFTPSAGIEPTFQEPESCVLSVAPRGQNINDLHIII